jgi:hypothetical protein
MFENDWFNLFTVPTCFLASTTDRGSLIAFDPSLPAGEAGLRLA